MQIDIPEIELLITVEIDHYAPTRVGRVMFGDAEVYCHTLDDQRSDVSIWYRSENEEREAMTAFGKMLALKIGD